MAFLDAANRILKHSGLAQDNQARILAGGFVEQLAEEAHDMVAADERYDCPEHGLQPSYYCAKLHPSGWAHSEDCPLCLEVLR